MIVPDYWAEARKQHRSGGKQVTVRRFGWSVVSIEEAQAMAEERVDDALRRILAGEQLPRREQKHSYGWDGGVPIREEVIRRSGENVITRNSYGALCLNTPDVMFVDADVVPVGKPLGKSCFVTIGVALAAALVAIWFQNPVWLLIALPLLLLMHGMRKMMASVQMKPQPDIWQAARERIAGFSANHPDWNLRVYRTPAGFRILVMHDVFDPGGEAADRCFKELKSDVLYARMCVCQQCFRARVSPKPWRAGISKHMRPRPGVWPVSDDKLPLRREWVREYEIKSSAFAACEFVEELGSGSVHPKADAVRILHDELSRAHSGLPLA